MAEHLVAEVGIHLEPGTAGTPDLKRQEQMSINKINNNIVNTKYPDKIQLEFNSLLFILCHIHISAGKITNVIVMSHFPGYMLIKNQSDFNRQQRRCANVSLTYGI